MATVKLTPTSKEISLYKNLFNEAAFMGGTEIKFHSVETKEITNLSSVKYSWRDPIPMNIIYDQRPKVSLLKRLNWFSEDTEEQPKIMYIPSKVKLADGTEKVFTEVEIRGALVEVVNDVNTIEPAVFQISDTRTDMVSLYYICNVIPYREPKVPEGTGKSKNNKWLNT